MFSTPIYDFAVYFCIARSVQLAFHVSMLEIENKSLKKIVQWAKQDKKTHVFFVYHKYVESRCEVMEWRGGRERERERKSERERKRNKRRGREKKKK